MVSGLCYFFTRLVVGVNQQTVALCFYVPKLPRCLGVSQSTRVLLVCQLLIHFGPCLGSRDISMSGQAVGMPVALSVLTTYRAKKALR